MTDFYCVGNYLYLHVLQTQSENIFFVEKWYSKEQCVKASVYIYIYMKSDPFLCTP